MGIDGLWPIIKPASREVTLTELVIDYGWDKSNPHNISKLGVDISTVVNECIAADHASHMYRYRTNGPMRTMLFKLCALLREAPIVVVFVFDGPLRPERKHGREINTEIVPEWVEECKTLIDAFGFYSHEAPGEADAELAMLNATGAIDFILTSDSDTIAFGGQRILRKSKSPGKYSLYTCEAIRDKCHTMDYYKSTCAHTCGGTHPGPLDKGAFILIALLSGNDYHDGLPGCGIQTATALAGAGYGTRVLDTFNTLTGQELETELRSIKFAMAEELQYNSLGIFVQRNDALAVALREDNKVLTAQNICAFAYPLVSTSEGSSASRSRPAWLGKYPDIERIGQFCENVFHWTRPTLEKNLKSVLFPGLLLRMITSRYLTWDDIGPHNMCVVVGAISEIHAVAVAQRGGTNTGQWAHIKFTTNDFLRRLGIDGIPPTIAHGLGHTELTWIRVEYVPASILAMANHPETRLSSRKHPKKRRARSPSEPVHKRSTAEDFEESLKQLKEIQSSKDHSVTIALTSTAGKFSGLKRKRS